MNSIDAASRYQAEGVNADAAQSIVSGVLQESSKASEDMLIERQPVSDALPPEREVGDDERLKRRLQAGFVAEADGTRYGPRIVANAHGLSCRH